MSVDTAIEAIYDSLTNDNENIDSCIGDLKAALKDAGETEAVFDPAMLVQNNREGRKRMQSYFKKRGVIVKFRLRTYKL